MIRRLDHIPNTHHMWGPEKENRGDMVKKKLNDTEVRPYT